MNTYNEVHMRLIDHLYVRVLKPILFLVHPDYIHELFIHVGKLSGAFGMTRALLHTLYGYRGPDISKTVDGITYHTPILLSAGFDADGALTRILSSLSFGGEEIGSVTALPCKGNPRPNNTRLIRNKSLVVYKGLRNRGVDALIAHLSATPREKDLVLGISIARTNAPESCTDNDAGIADFATSFQKLNAADIGDYYTINISCPNAFGGEAFTTPTLLAALLNELAQTPTTKPVYLKMPINLEWDDFAQLLAAADAHPFVRGVVIGNLNKNYAELDHPEDAPTEFRGGLSGKPCFARSNNLIRRTREAYQDRFTIIGVGGIFTPEDAMEKLASGADLVQMITGMIWGGPGIVRRIAEHYATERT